MLACRNRCVSMVMLLLSLGADPTLTTPDGLMSALDFVFLSDGSEDEGMNMFILFDSLSSC